MPLIDGAVGSQNYTAQARYIDGEGRIYFNPLRMDFPLITFLGVNGRKGPIVGDAYGGDTKIEGKSLSKRQVENSQYYIFTDTVQDSATTINLLAGYSASATSLVVADGTLFVANDLALVVRTGETVLVTATSTNTLTVTRGWGSTAQAINNLDSVVRIGPAYAVNALSGTPKSTQVQQDYNYTQIFRTPLAISRTDRDSRLNYTNTTDWERLKMEAAVEHLRQQERAFWYGRRNESTDVNGQRQRSTGGLFQFITSNVSDVSASGGVLTPQLFDAFAETAFQYGQTQKYLFCSPRMLSRINGLSEHLIRMKPEETSFGQDLTKYTTSHGEFILIRTPHFGAPGLGDKYSGTAVCVDPDQIKFAYLKNAENEYRDNIQEPDRDGVKAEWLCEAGVHLANEKAHAILQGVI